MAVVAFVLPKSLLIVLSIVAVALADTRFTSYEFIYYARFVPIGVLAVKACAEAIVKRKLIPQRVTLIRVFIPFILFAGCSIIYTADRQLVFQRYLSMLFVFAGFGIGIPTYYSLDQLDKIIKPIGIILGMGIIYSFLTSQGQPAGDSVHGIERRAYGIFYNPNTLGLLGMQSFFILLYFLQKSRFKSKMFLAAVLLVLIAILSSGSRASLLGVLIGSYFYIIGYSKIYGKRMKTIFTFGLIAGACILIIFQFFPEYQHSFMRGGVEYDETGIVTMFETSSRTILWERAWIIAQRSLWFGVGFSGSDYLFYLDSLYLKSIGIFISGPHSSLFRLLVDLGLVGVAMAFLTFWMLLRKIWKAIPRFQNSMLGLCLFAMVMASLVNSMFESWLFAFGNSSTLPFYLCLAILSYQYDSIPKQQEAVVSLQTAAKTVQ